MVACDSRPVVNYDGRGPHHSVHLVFNGRGRDQLVTVPGKPTPFACEPPCGPLQPFFSAWTESEANVHDQATLDSEFAALCVQMEQEWLNIYQIPYTAQYKYVGRGEKQRFKQRAVLPPATGGGVARPPFVVSLRWVALHCSTILAYLRSNNNGINNYSLCGDACRAARSLVVGGPRFLVLNSPFS